MSDDQSPGQGRSGSVVDIVGRMRAVLPAPWFPIATPASQTTTTPVLDGVLSGIAQAWSFCHALLAFVRLQTRLATASGSFIDLYAGDFFGSDFRRATSETDEAFRQRIQATLLPAKATRPALIDMLLSMTGVVQPVIEPTRAMDTGGYGSMAIAYGSSRLPYQFLLAIVTGLQTTRRETVASYIDAAGRLAVADRHVVRNLYTGGVATGLLVEKRSFNLIKDSMGWSGFTIAATSQLVTWSVCDGGAMALWSGNPVISLSIAGSGLIIGPSVSVPTAGAVTGSIWVRVPGGQQLGTLKLAMFDGTTSWYSAVDLTVIDSWQSVSVTVTQPTGSVRVGLVGTSNGVTQDLIYTQCWQVEPGSSATSYIPSSMQIGFRDADVIVDTGKSSEAVSAANLAVMRNAVNRVMPAGCVAWLSS